MTGQRKEKYRIIPKLLLMKCVCPILRKMLQTIVNRKKPLQQRHWTINEYLLQNRKQVERKVQKFVDSEKYISILYPSESSHELETDMEKWDIKLLVFVLVDICMIDPNSKYYLADVENIASDLSHPDSFTITKHIYREYKKRLRKARSRFYKLLDYDDIKSKIEKRAKKIEKGKTNKTDEKDILKKWNEVESNPKIEEGCKRNGLHRYLTINLLLSETCCDVMRAVVRQRVVDLKFKSLDRFLYQEKNRIDRRIRELDTFGRPEDILFPRHGTTHLRDWDITLLCWILLNVCYLSRCVKHRHPDALADAIGKFREVRNKTVHKLFSSLNVSESEYELFLQDIKGSIETCLVYINDPDFSEDIDNKVEEIERTAMSNDETIKRLQMCQKDRAEHELQSNYLQGQSSIIRELSTIVRKFTGVPIPECTLELVLDKCSEDCEKKLSAILVDNINQLLTGNETPDLHDDLKTAVAQLIERFKEKGWKILSAEHGSVLLHTKCTSFEDLANLYEAYGNKGSTLGTGEIEKAAQRIFGSFVTVSLIMYTNEMDECIENVVNALLERTDQLTKRASAISNKKVRLWFDFDHDSEGFERPEICDIKTRNLLEKIADIFKNRFNIPSLSISSKLHGGSINENLEVKQESEPKEKSVNINTSSSDRSGQGQYSNIRGFSSAVLTIFEFPHPDLKQLKHNLIQYIQTNTSSSKLLSPLADDEFIAFDLELDELLCVQPLCRCEVYSRIHILTDSQPRPILRKYRDIFEGGSRQFDVIYISGEAGMGKTAFCRKLITDWCTAHSTSVTYNDTENYCEEANVSYLTKFDFIFPISLANTNDSSIENMIVNQLEIHPSILMECLRKMHCLVVLDGLDEWAVPGSNTDRYEPPKMNSVHRFILLITSRPWKILKTSENKGIHVRGIKIKGLSTENMYLMIKSTLARMLKAQNIHSTQFHDKYVSKFMQEIQETKYDGILRIPRMLKASLCLWYQQNVRLQSRISLYRNLLYFMRSYSSRVERCEFGILENLTLSYQALRQPTLEYLNFAEANLYISALSKMAFKMSFAKHTSTCVCTQCIISDYLRPDELAQCLEIGILTSESNELRTISFLNKSVQEFYAALHFSTNFLDCMTTLKDRTTSVERALELSGFLLFLGGTNPLALKIVVEHIHDLVDSDERFQIAGFKREHDESDRTKNRILVKRLSNMITDSTAESVYDSLIDFNSESFCLNLSGSVLLRDLYIDNESVQTVLACLPHISTSCLKSLHIFCDCNSTSTMKKIQSVVEKTKDIVEMLNISDITLFEQVFLHIECMRSLKSLGLSNLALTIPQVKQILRSAPKLLGVFLYNFESKGEPYVLLSCVNTSVQNCSKKSREKIFYHSLMSRNEEKYPELQELTFELVHNDFIRMKKIFSSITCCTNVQNCL